MRSVLILVLLAFLNIAATCSHKHSDQNGHMQEHKSGHHDGMQKK